MLARRKRSKRAEWRRGDPEPINEVFQMAIRDTRARHHHASVWPLGAIGHRMPLETVRALCSAHAAILQGAGVKWASGFCVLIRHASAMDSATQSVNHLRTIGGVAS